MQKIASVVFFLLCIISSGTSAQPRSEKNLDGYLFAYFEGSGDGNKQEQLRFATSQNGVNWYALTITNL